MTDLDSQRSTATLSLNADAGLLRIESGDGVRELAMPIGMDATHAAALLILRGFMHHTGFVSIHKA